jgi:hypothetical protein
MRSGLLLQVLAQVETFRQEKVLTKVSMVAHACNPSYLEGRDCEDHNQGQPRQKVSKAPSQQMRQVWWCVPVIPATPEAIGRGTVVQAGPRQKRDTLSKNI